MKNILTALFIALTFTLSANQDSTAVIIEETSNDFIIGPGYPYGYGQYEASISRWNGGSRNVTEDFSSPFYMTFTVEKQLNKAKEWCTSSICQIQFCSKRKNINLYFGRS